MTRRAFSCTLSGCTASSRARNALFRLPRRKSNAPASAQGCFNAREKSVQRLLSCPNKQSAYPACLPETIALRRHRTQGSCGERNESTFDVSARIGFGPDRHLCRLQLCSDYTAGSFYWYRRGSVAGDRWEEM